MIALGWTAQGVVARPRFRTVDQPFCATIAVAQRFAATPRDRIRLQVDCARSLPTFLPLAPTLRMSVEEAVEHGRLQGASIASRLEALHGRAQISLRVSWPNPAPLHQPAADRIETGRDWLVVRASARRRDAARRSQLAEGLRAILSAWSTGPVAERHDARGLHLDTLVPTGQVPDLGALGRALQSVPERGDASFALSGPWPALSFTCLAGLRT